MSCPDRRATADAILRSVALVGLVLVACARAAVGFPGDVRVASPAPGLAPELAAILGVWEGLWADDGRLTLPGTGLPSRVAVEEIDAAKATVVYGWAASPGAFDAGWARVDADVRPGPTLAFAFPNASFTLALAADRLSIAGVRLAGSTRSTITYRRVP